MKKNKSACLLTLSCLAFALVSCGPDHEQASNSGDSSTSGSITSSDPTGQSSSDSSASKTVKGYRRIETLDELVDGGQYMIAAYDGASLYGFKNENKENSSTGGVYSWYFKGQALNEVNSHGDVQDILDAALFKVSASGDSYTFSIDGNYLSGYVSTSGSKTYYSIGMVDSIDVSCSWSISFGDNGKAQMKSDSGVYLEYYKSSFCGYSKTADVYLYTAADISIDNGSNSSNNSNSSNSYSGTDSDEGWEGIDFATYGNTFRKALETRISAYRTKTISYTSCLSTGAAAAAYPAGSNTFVPFYHAVPGTTEGITGNGAMTTTQSACNREHTWPNSRGSGKSGPGSDPFIIRPTLTSENSSRGNSFYGTGNGEWDPASCGYEGARGEAARVTLYAATAYYSSYGFELSNNPSDDASKKTMGTLKTLLKWNAQYPVSDMEKQINNYLCKQGLGRNPFVDHPEYANYIWDENGLRSTAFNGGSTTISSSYSSTSTTLNNSSISNANPGEYSGQTSELLNLADHGFEDYANPTTLSDSYGVTVAFVSGSSKATYFSDSNTVRLYSNGGVNVTSPYNLSNVEVVYTVNANKNDVKPTDFTLAEGSKSTSIFEDSTAEITKNVSLSSKEFSLKVTASAGNIALKTLTVTFA